MTSVTRPAIRRTEPTSPEPDVTTQGTPPVGVIQLDKLNDMAALVLLQAEGGPQNLKTIALP